MTDHQQAAIEAGAREAKERWSMTACTGDDCVVWTGVSEAVITAAEPHLRKKWAEEIIGELDIARATGKVYTYGDVQELIREGTGEDKDA